MRPIILAPIWAAIAFVLYKVVVRITTNRRNAREAQLRGCKPAPIFHNADPLGLISVYRTIKANSKGQLNFFFQDRFNTVSKQEGREVFTIHQHILRGWLFATCDPKNIQALLATQFKDFELGPIRFGTFSPLLGHGIFSADGKQWEHSRALLRPQFAREQVSDLELEENHLQNLMQAIPVTSSGWTSTADLIPIFFRLTIDSASEFLFGESVDTQTRALPEYNHLEKGNAADDQAFVQAFELSQDYIANSFRFNEYYKLGLNKEFYETCKVCHTYIDRFVSKALSTPEKYLESGEKQKYVFLNELAKVTKDPIEIRDQSLSILVAGRDTTASLLSFLFSMLATHPAVFQKLRKTILNEFGSYSSTSKITFSSLKACSYLQWCMNETLRLFPTVPLNSRRSIVDTTLPRGGGADGQAPIFIPKGTEVNYSVFIMHRHPEIWGNDSNEFNPDRWNGRKPGFEYLPFNGGPRICLGQQFALTEAGYVTVRLLQRFDQLEIDGLEGDGIGQDWFQTLTGRPKHGVNVRFHESSSV